MVIELYVMVLLIDSKSIGLFGFVLKFVWCRRMKICGNIVYWVCLYFIDILNVNFFFFGGKCLYGNFNLLCLGWIMLRLCGRDRKMIVKVEWRINIGIFGFSGKKFWDRLGNI